MEERDELKVKFDSFDFYIFKLRPPPGGAVSQSERTPEPRRVRSIRAKLRPSEPERLPAKIKAERLV